MQQHHPNHHAHAHAHAHAHSHQHPQRPYHHPRAPMSYAHSHSHPPHPWMPSHSHRHAKMSFGYSSHSHSHGHGHGHGPPQSHQHQQQHVRSFHPRHGGHNQQHQHQQRHSHGQYRNLPPAHNNYNARLPPQSSSSYADLGTGNASGNHKHHHHPQQQQQSSSSIAGTPANCLPFKSLTNKVTPPNTNDSNTTPPMNKNRESPIAPSPQPLAHDTPTIVPPSQEEGDGQQRLSSIISQESPFDSDHEVAHVMEACCTKPPVDSPSRQPSTLPTPKPSKKLQGLSFKSPITLCFERMLGAAEYIKTPDAPRTKPLKKRKAQLSLLDSDSDVDEPHVQAEAETKENAETSENRSKRRKSSVGQTVGPKTKDSMANRLSIFTVDQAAHLDEENPFRKLANNPDLRQHIVVQMAMHRDFSTNPDPTAGTTLNEGFYWRDYPQLEQVLYDSMPEYYKISSASRQSRMQQSFNNSLVQKMRKTATENGLVFHAFFDNRNLRDRIRCFFKTHLQNAKKRLATLHKHPESRDHQSTLRIFMRCVEEDIPYVESANMEPVRSLQSYSKQLDKVRAIGKQNS